MRHASWQEAVLMTRRTFGTICAASGATAAVTPLSAAAPGLGGSPRRHDQSTATAQDNDKLLSEWLFDLVIDTQPPHTIGDHLVSRFRSSLPKSRARRPDRKARRPSILGMCERGATLRGGMPRQGIW